MRVTLGHKGRYAHTVQETGELEQREQLLAIFGGASANEHTTVGRIDQALAHRIGSNTDLVRVSPITVMKIKGKHTTVTHYDLELLPHAFATGRVQQDHPRHLTFIFRDPRDAARTLKVVLKATRQNELLISTYYLCTKGQLRYHLASSGDDIG